MNVDSIAYGGGKDADNPWMSLLVILCLKGTSGKLNTLRQHSSFDMDSLWLTRMFRMFNFWITPVV